MYIVFEGPWGSGKSTQAKNSVEYLKSIFPQKQVIYTREPGGTEVAEAIRKVVLGTNFEEKCLPITDVYLFAASRSQSLRKIVRPVLNSGGIVVADSSYITSLSLQGGAQEMTFDEVLGINRAAVGENEPDFIFYLDIDIELAAKRTYDSANDKFENEDLNFGKKRVEAYKQASELPTFKHKWININGNGSEIEVFERIKGELKKIFSNKKPKSLNSIKTH